MKFLKEAINSISKEATIFLQEHPEFTEQIKAFEQEFSISDSLKNSKDLADLLTSNVWLRDYEEDSDYGDGGTYMDSSNFGDPQIDSASYYVTKENQLAIETEISWEGEGQSVSDWVPHTYYEPGYWNNEYDVTIYAKAYIDAVIPQDVTDYDKYVISGDDDIEYEA